MILPRLLSLIKMRMNPAAIDSTAPALIKRILRMDSPLSLGTNEQYSMFWNYLHELIF